MSDLDKLGSFYLGRKYDLANGETSAEPLLYDSKDLTTHAVCVGMTGSGKTGLCLSLLEEAALDGIPAIAIDPKGDLSNLLLAFPKLEASDFRPWIDEGEAARKQESPDEFAAAQAELWRTGLAKWDEGPERIQHYVDSAERIIYTPGSNAGIPITVLKSFAAPPAVLIEDSEAFGERVSSAASGLLTLMGIDADPVRSREHIFLSHLLETAWRAGKDVDLAQLIRDIQKPSFNKVGIVDLESFYPAAERTKLSMNLNNLLASPTFAGWMQGEPLDIARMLYTPQGRPRIAIISIAHLDDSQRMFFVTLLLNEVLAWIRTQPGTSSLRALLYMDEVFGYFPPICNPPAKRPMLTLLKQARAYGLGCILATQNPVDLDYKGLSNAGTWFLGRLQTERDKARVIEGLEGASAQAGAKFNRKKMEATLAGLSARVFLMNNVHDDEPVVFHTRWALSYLRGPMTREQIKRLMDPVRANFVAGKQAAPETVAEGGGQGEGVPTKAAASAKSAAATPASNNQPILPPTISEKFIAINERVPDGYRLEYRPGLLGEGKVHFVRKSDGIDIWRECFLLQTIHDRSPDDVWDGAFNHPQDLITDDEPDAAARFADLPSEFTRDKSYGVFARQLREHLFREESLKVWKCAALDQCSKPDEEEADFRARLEPMLEERLTVEREKVESKRMQEIAIADKKIANAETDANVGWWRKITQWGGVVYVIADWFAMMNLKSGLPGRRRSLDPALRTVATESGRAAKARIALESAQKEKNALEQQYDEKLKSLEAKYASTSLQLEQVELKPQKSDIEIDKVSLAWLPWRISASGQTEPMYL